MARGLRAASLAADLTDAAAVGALAERVRDATAGRLHAVVHLAGGFASSGPVSESDPAVWGRQLATNATTAYLTARAFLPLLRGVKGSLVFFASEAVLPGGRSANASAYVASKSAVVALMQAVAQEERAHGVRANAVAPGTIRTTDNVAAMGADTPMVTREAVALANPDVIVAREVAAALGEQDISVWSGHAYAWELARALGIRDTGGAIRVSLAPYTAESDLDRLVTAVSEMVA